MDRSKNQKIQITLGIPEFRGIQRPIILCEIIQYNIAPKLPIPDSVFLEFARNPLPSREHHCEMTQGTPTSCPHWHLILSNSPTGCINHSQYMVLQCNQRAAIPCQDTMPALRVPPALVWTSNAPGTGSIFGCAQSLEMSASSLLLRIRFSTLY